MDIPVRRDRALRQVDGLLRRWAIRTCDPRFVLPVTLLVGSAGIVSAQDSTAPPSVQSSTDDPSAPSSNHVISPTYVPLMLRQKYLVTVGEVAGPGPLIALGIHTLIDSATNTPHQWGVDEESIGLRVASSFGRSFLRQNIAFGVRALDHEDPRYFRSGHGNPLSRLRYATVHTFAVRKDDGSTMPAYSLFVSASTMPLIAQSWRPEPFSVARGAAGSGISLGIAVAANLWYEFWPDFREQLPRKLRGSDQIPWLTPASSTH